MYIATQDFRAYMVGEVKKGEVTLYNKAWLDGGLIEEVDSKPEPKKEIETKPNKQKKKTK